MTARLAADLDNLSDGRVILGLGFVPLDKVYSYEPIPAALPPNLHHHILGVQGNVWTEYMPNFRHVEYMVFPRACALSEVGWSPKTARNWEDFSSRLSVHLQRLAALNVNYRRESGVTTTSFAPFDPIPNARQQR